MGGRKVTGEGVGWLMVVMEAVACWVVMGVGVGQKMKTAGW